MSQILLIRPGSTDFDEQQRIQGTLDLPLNLHGEEQVARIVRELADIVIDVIFTTPCEPARTTAVALGAARGVSVKPIDLVPNLD